MTFESNKKIEKLDDAVVGDRFGNDMDSDAYCDDAGHGGNNKGKIFHVQESGIVNVIDHETLAQENFARSVLDMCPEPTKKEKLASKSEAEESSQESSSEDEANGEDIVVKDSSLKNQLSEKKKKSCEMWPIARDADPVCEFTDNGMLVGGSFPYLFLRGDDMLPHGSFPTKLVRHFFLHYDGRFEKCAPFICLLFNQLYRHLGLRKIASAATTNSKIRLSTFDVLN